MVVADRPAWFTATTLADWPTHPVELASCRVRTRVPTTWRPTAPVELDTHAEAGYTERGRPDGLTAHRIAGVDPTVDIRRWVEASIGIGGPPVVGAPERTGRLLDWHDEGASTVVVADLGVDEAHASQWLIALGPELVRTYVMVARRGVTAWKIELSLTTACPPGSPDSVVDVNDHVRAGVVLGNLQLLDGRP